MGECEIFKEERDLLEMKIGECDMEKFGTLDSREKTIAILGDRLWSQTAKRKGHKLNQEFLPGTNMIKRSQSEEIDGGHRRRNGKGIN